MDNETLLRRMEAFDPELSDLLLSALDRQCSTLSLIPTANAVSPFSAYLKGSVLGNDFMDHHAIERRSRLEKMACQRAKQLFHSGHAIVRIGNPVAAARVVFYALAQPDSTILSFNLRKQEHCTGDWMNYNFVKFSLEPDTLAIDYEKVRQLALSHKPRIIIYSPVNYPQQAEYEKFRKIADEAGAYLWVDIGQNAGLVATGLVPSPVPYADVVTFGASDALHGPQNGIILSTAQLAPWLDQAVIDTGHVSLKKNVLAALAITFQEAAAEEFTAYCQQTLKNAMALEKGLREAGVNTLCGPTANHLVLAQLREGIDGDRLTDNLALAGLMVKPEQLLTSGDLSFPVLRLSSLDPTTRSLKEKDMLKVGTALGSFINSGQKESDISDMAKTVKKIIDGRPLFSEEWLPDAEADDSQTDMMEKMIYWNI